MLLSEPLRGAEIIAGGLLWRVLVEWIYLPDSWSKREKVKNILLKLTWSLATGDYLATLAYTAAAAFLAVVVVIAFLSAAWSKSGRSNRRRG